MLDDDHGDFVGTAVREVHLFLLFSRRMSVPLNVVRRILNVIHHARWKRRLV